MGIRIEHQGAGAGAGIDLVAQQKRKYDLQLKQQEKQQDLMTKVGLQNREAMMREYQDANQNTIRQGLINAANERQDANWARDQKVAADQQRQAAANARAMKTGTIRSSIEGGEYNPSDAAKLQGYLDEQDRILNDKQSNDDQKANALATLDGQMEPYLGRKKAPTPQGPVPWEQADPKFLQGLYNDAQKRLQQSGKPYKDSDAWAAARADYDNMVGLGQSPQAAPQQNGQPSPTGSPQQQTSVVPPPQGLPQGTPERIYGEPPAKPKTPQEFAEQNPKEWDSFRGRVGDYMTAEYTQKYQDWADSENRNQANMPARPTPLEVDAAAAEMWSKDHFKKQQSGWTPWDKKNYGDGFTDPETGETVKAAPGAEIKPHEKYPGYFTVNRADGKKAQVFNSRAAAEIFQGTADPVQEQAAAPEPTAGAPAQAPQVGAPPVVAPPEAVAPPAAEAGAAQAPSGQAPRFVADGSGELYQVGTDEDGRTYVKTLDGRRVILTEEETQQFLSGGQAVAPQAQPQQAAQPAYGPPEGPTAPTQAGVAPQPSAPVPQQEQGQPAPQQAGAQPSAQSPPKNEYAAYGSSPTSPQPQPQSPATGAPPQADRGERQQPKSTRGFVPTVPTSAVRSPEGLAKSSTISNFTGKERLVSFRPAPGAKVQVSPDGKQFFVTDSKGKPVQFGSKEKAQEFIDTEKLETLAGEQNDLMSGKSKSFDGDFVEGPNGELKWIEGAAYDPAAFNWDTAIKATEPALRKAKENIREFASTQPKPVQDAIQIMLDKNANTTDKFRATEILRIAKVDLKAIMQGKNGTSGTGKKKS